MSSTQVYEWPDGTSLTLDFNEDGVSSFFFDFCGGGELLIRRTGHYIHLASVNDLLTRQDISKLFGFALDIRATIRPPLWAKKSDGFDRLQMPRWVSDEEWEKRYDLPNVKVDPFENIVQISNWFEVRDLRMLQSSKGDFNAAWTSTWTPSRTMSVQAVWSGVPTGKHQICAIDAEDAKRKVVDHILETERILPMSQREEWESANVQRGRFLVPTPEEVEIFRLLDLPLPFFFPDSQLREWIEGRTA